MAIRSPQVRDVEPVAGVFPGFPYLFAHANLYPFIISLLLYHSIIYIYVYIKNQNQFYPDDQSAMIGFLPVMCSNHLQLCPIYPTLLQLQAGHGQWESLRYLPLLGLNFLVCLLLLVTYFSFEKQLLYSLFFLCDGSPQKKKLTIHKLIASGEDNLDPSGRTAPGGTSFARTPQNTPLLLRLPAA